MRKKFEPLTDSKWQVIAEFLPKQRKRRIDLRKVVRGLDGNKKINGRKRQVLVDTLGLVGGVVVHAANGGDSIYEGVIILEVKQALIV